MIIAMRESTTRRRAAAWSFTGSTYLASTGAAGSYADAANDLAAKVFLPGSVLGTASFLCWVRATISATQYVVIAYSAGNASVQLRVTTTSTGTVSARSFDDANALNASTLTSQSATWTGTDWVLVALTITTGAADLIRCYNSNNAASTASDATPDAHAAGIAFRLFATDTGAALLTGDIRSPAVFDRYVADTEIAELHTLGPTHDLRVASGNYTGAGPVHWWPADGDSGTTVTDRGSVGGCDLTLNGGVTIEAA